MGAEIWLAPPTDEGMYKVYTDFCASALGAALHQIQNSKEVPIAFASRVCRGPKTALDSPSGELAAVIYALGKFRGYLGYSHFELVTDSTSVRALQS